MCRSLRINSREELSVGEEGVISREQSSVALCSTFFCPGWQDKVVVWLSGVQHMQLSCSVGAAAV